jgi:hypothetical protein
MLQIQMGKAKELFSVWGVRPKELDNLVEAGVVRTRQAGRGRGSLRLLDEDSILDVYLAHSFGTVGLPRRRIAELIGHFRPHYRSWLRDQEKVVIVEFKASRHYPVFAPSIWINLAQPLRLISTCAQSGEEVASIHRGRPKEDWRKQFRLAASAIAKEMSEKGLTEDDVDTAIAGVRARRKARAGKDRTAVVTVPAT